MLFARVKCTMTEVGLNTFMKRERERERERERSYGRLSESSYADDEPKEAGVGETGKA